MKMPTKEQRLNLLGILATASLTGIGFVLGGTTGAEFMKGIGINLTSSIIQGGAVKLKEQWLSNKSGALNHDIQQALTRATIKALENLENRYLTLHRDSISEDDKKSIKNLFKDLNEQAVSIFPVLLERVVTEHDVKDYIYGKPDNVASNVWERISQTNILEDIHREWFKDYFIKNFFLEIQFWFGEELKTDKKECNRAWRAFQRLLLEGIQADVNALQVSQDLILKKLDDRKKLDEIREQLELLEDKIDRQPNEPFQRSLELAIEQIRGVLDGIYDTTRRTEAKVDEIKDIAGRIEKRLGKPYEERQELLNAIIENYASQIPYYELRVKEFVTENRTYELTNALTYIQDHRILLISGIGGVGKTTLARQPV
jgi:phage gp36-like protein